MQARGAVLTYDGGIGATFYRSPAAQTRARLGLIDTWFTARRT